MMTLTKELTDIVAAYNPSLAFLASDCIGMRNWTGKAPYCLMAHGTYQDTHCRPEAWPYGLLPNYRNVLWSCNWAPVTNFHFTEYGTETFETPVAISNGLFGDDIGVSEMKGKQLVQVLELFEKRKNVPMQISWIEDEKGEPLYKGKKLKYWYSV